jgi:hypothetical protein
MIPKEGGFGLILIRGTVKRRLQPRNGNLRIARIARGYRDNRDYFLNSQRISVSKALMIRHVMTGK